MRATAYSVSNSLNAYHQACTIENLGKEKEAELALAAQAGDDQARNRLAKNYLRLVIKIAKRFEGRGLDLDDCVMEGNFGLFHAIRKFDPSKGYRFSTYAAPWVMQYIDIAVMNQSRTVRIPVYQQKRAKSSRAETTDLSMGVSIEQEIEDGQQFPIDGDSALESIQHEQLAQIFDQLLAAEKPKKRAAVMARFGLDDGRFKTFEAAAERSGVTRERVRQMVAEFADKHRTTLEEMGVTP